MVILLVADFVPSQTLLYSSQILFPKKRQIVDALLSPISNLAPFSFLPRQVINKTNGLSGSVVNFAPIQPHFEVFFLFLSPSLRP